MGRCGGGGGLGPGQGVEEAFKGVWITAQRGVSGTLGLLQVLAPCHKGYERPGIGVDRCVGQKWVPAFDIEATGSDADDEMIFAEADRVGGVEAIAGREVEVVAQCEHDRVAADVGVEVPKR